MNTRSKFILVGLSTLLCVALLYFLLPKAISFYISMQEYSKRVEQSYDYTKITTPLPENTLRDICSKFQIEIDDPRCAPHAVTYAPDFYDDIRKYFGELPEEVSTFQTVQDKLGDYLVRCEEPDNEGFYRCRYDIRGDGIYPIGIYFNKEGFYYRIDANIGGS